MGTDVTQLVPMAHVPDVERSICFYALLGFAVRNRLRHGGQTRWAWLDSGNAALMLTAADAPVDPTQQAILFYLYSHDVAGLRAHLLAHGCSDGGDYCGLPGPNGGRSVVFNITYPDYMQHGELRVADPDGYCLLIGQI